MAGFSTSATPCASSITVFLTSGGLSQSQNALVAPAASVPLKIAARKSRHVRPRLACVAASDCFLSCSADFSMLDAAPFKVSAACCWCRLHVAACSRLACCCSATVCRLSSASVAKLSANGSISAANCSAFRACLKRIIALTVDCLPIVLYVNDLGVGLLNLQCSRSAFGLDALGLHLDHVGADVNLRHALDTLRLWGAVIDVGLVPCFLKSHVGTPLP